MKLSARWLSTGSTSCLGLPSLVSSVMESAGCSCVTACKLSQGSKQGVPVPVCFSLHCSLLPDVQCVENHCFTFFVILSRFLVISHMCGGGRKNFLHTVFWIISFQPLFCLLLPYIYLLGAIGPIFITVWPLACIFMPYYWMGWHSSYRNISENHSYGNISTSLLIFWGFNLEITLNLQRSFKHRNGKRTTLYTLYPDHPNTNSSPYELYYFSCFLFFLQLFTCLFIATWLINSY